MNAAFVLVVLLSHQGYWFGGDQNDIGVQWAARGGQPTADLIWELDYGSLKLTSGKTQMLPDPAATVIHLTPPDVRVRVEMKWKYSLVSREGARERERGEIAIRVFPHSLIDGLTRRVGDSTIAVWDRTGALADLLHQARVPYVRVTNASKLAFAQPQAVLIGADTLDASPFTQGPLIELAKGGASVMIFEQQSTDTLGGYQVVRREAPAKLDWATDHVLLRGMDREMLKSLESRSETILALRLPTDEPVLAIAAWPRETPGMMPVPMDALLLTKAIGKGRLVLSQISLNDWEQDPRAQLFLMNAMDYLLTSPEPTPRPSVRPVIRIAEPRLAPSIPLLSGDRS